MKPQQASSLKSQYLIIFLCIATELIGFGLFIPILPQLALKFNVEGWMMGLLVSSFSFCQFIASPILGSLSDKFGRKKILVISKLGTCLSYLLLANTNTYPLFLLARCLDGFTGGNISVARACLIDITPGENKSKGMAIIGISFATGFILGPALGSFIFNYSPTHYLAAYVAALFSFVAMLLTLFLLKEPSKQASTEPWQLLRPLPKNTNKAFMYGIFLTHFFFMCLFTSFEATLSVFTELLFNFTPAQNSKLFLLAGFFALIVQGYYSKRPFQNLRLAVLIGLSLSCLGYFTLYITTQFYSIIFALCCISLGVGTMFTHLPSLLTKKSNSHMTGQLMGFYDSVGSISRFIGPQVIYSFFFDSISQAYLVSSVVLIFVFVFFLMLTKQANTKLAA